MSETTTVRFVVEAEFLVNFARRVAWFDGDRAHAKSILGSVVSGDDPRQGLAGHIIDAILDGDATLTGDSAAGIDLIERSDRAWKRTVEQRRDFYARQAMERARELEEAARDAAQRTEVQEAVAALSRQGAAIPLEDETPASRGRRKWAKVGGYKVPAHLLDRYIATIERIRRGAFLGVSAELQNDPLAFLQLEERRVEIHDAILAAIGLVRGTDAETQFTMALHAKHGLLGGVRPASPEGARPAKEA